MEYKHTLVSGEPGKVDSRKGFHTRSEAAEAWVRAQEAEPEKTHKVVDLTVSDVMELAEDYAQSVESYESTFSEYGSSSVFRELAMTRMKEAQEELRATIEGLLS